MSNTNRRDVQDQMIKDLLTESDINAVSIIVNRLKTYDKTAALFMHSILNDLSKSSYTLQVSGINNLLRRWLYTYAGRTKNPTAYVMAFIKDDLDHEIWLDTLEKGVFPLFKQEDILGVRNGN